MENKQKLLELRSKIKKNKPEFIRQDAHKQVKLKKKWRKPKGLQSKMRHNFRGYRRSVSQGYRSPRDVRGMHKSGVKEIIVNNIKDVENIKEKEGIGIVISGKVGTRRKIEILKKCQESKLKVLNVKESEMFIKNVEDRIKKMKEEKEEKKKEKSEKKKERERFAKEKEEKEKKKKDEETTKDGEGDLTEKIEKEESEEKKKKEKLEKDKILIQKK